MKLDKNIYNNTINFFKKRFIELFGLILISVFFLFSYSLFSYSPENSTLIYKIESPETGIILKKYLNNIADLFLQSFGLVSFLISVSILSWGINLIVKKKINNFLSKAFYTVLYINIGCLFVYLTNNNSFWLIDNGNSGFIGEQSFILLNKFTPLIEKNFVKVFLLFLTVVFFILASDINVKSLFQKFFLKKEQDKVQIDDSETEMNINENEKLETKQQVFSFKTSSEKKNN